jgi:hypothetical protein
LGNRASLVLVLKNKIESNFTNINFNIYIMIKKYLEFIKEAKFKHWGVG